MYDTPKVSYTVVIAVLKRAGVNLINDPGLPPIRPFSRHCETPLFFRFECVSSLATRRQIQRSDPLRHPHPLTEPLQRPPLLSVAPGWRKLPWPVLQAPRQSPEVRAMSYPP